MQARRKIFNLNTDTSLFNELIELSDFEAGSVTCTSFSDGEQGVFFQEDISSQYLYFFISTTTSADWVRLLLAVDAVNKTGVKKITVIMPYMGYARQDLKNQCKYTTSNVGTWASILKKCGVEQIITIDVHSDKARSYFADLDFINLSAQPLLKNHLKEKYFTSFPINSVAIVAPDEGSMPLAEKYFSDLVDIHPSLATIRKIRDNPNKVKNMELSGVVHNKHVIIVDDMADTCGTILFAERLLKQKGALSVAGVVTHGVLSGDALTNLADSNLSKLILTNTIFRQPHPLVEIVSVAPLLAEALS